MTGLSIANYGNYYTASTAKNSLTVKTPNGATVQPMATAKKTYTDVLTISEEAERLARLHETHKANTSAATSYQKAPTKTDFEESLAMAFKEYRYGDPWAPGKLMVDAYYLKSEWALGVNSEEAHLRNYAIIERAGFADGAYLLSGGHWTLPYIVRSEKMIIQSRLETTGNTLNEQIDNALKASGISLDEKARLNFSIDQSGKISITDGISDSDGRKQILEDILNGDDAIRSNLFLYQAQKNAIKSDDGVLDSPTQYLITSAYGWTHGKRTGVLQGNEILDERLGALEFSYQGGKIFQGDNVPEDRVFSDRLDSLDSLGKIIGLDESAAKDVQSFVSALERNIAVDSSKLTELLNAALDKAKLGDVKKKITFSQDADGNIVIEGNIRNNQKKRLAEIINSDSELSELIKTQGAKKAVLTELKKAVTDEPAIIVSGIAWKKHTARAGFDLSQDSLVSAREQLMKNFLDRNSISMSDLEADPDAVFEKHAEFDEIKGLRNEIVHLITPKTQKAESSATALQPLLAMKRGEVVDTETEGVDEKSIEEAIVDLKFQFNAWIEEANEFHTQLTGHSGLDIIDFTLTLDQNGQASLEVKTADGATESAEIAKQFLTTYFLKPDYCQDLGLTILETHDDEHGDVLEYNHSVVIKNSENGYRIESEEADQAALAEMEILTQDIGTALGDFFGKTMGIKNPFAIVFGSEGLSLGDGSLSLIESQAVKQVLENINGYLVAEEAGEDTKGMLSPELTAIGEKLIALKEVEEKIHDKSLLTKAGGQFTL